MAESAPSPAHPAPVPEYRHPWHRALVRAALGVLVLGLLGAAVVYVSADADSGGELAESMRNQRLYDYNLERIGGQSAILAVQFNAWLSSLWHGKRLAYSMATLSVAVAYGLYRVAQLLSTPLDDEDPPRQAH